jgi:hypothetical protein
MHKPYQVRHGGETDMRIKLGIISK